MPLVFFFAGLGFVLFAGVLGVMVAAMIANRAESRRWRAFAARQRIRIANETGEIRFSSGHSMRAELRYRWTFQQS
jgi:hypothetical protein